MVKPCDRLLPLTLHLRGYAPVPLWPRIRYMFKETYGWKIVNGFSRYMCRAAQRSKTASSGKQVELHCNIAQSLHVTYQTRFPTLLVYSSCKFFHLFISFPCLLFQPLHHPQNPCVGIFAHRSRNCKSAGGDSFRALTPNYILLHKKSFQKLLVRLKYH